MALRQTCLELAATEGRTRLLTIYLSGRRRGRGNASIATGLKPVVANALSGCITEAGRKRRLVARGN